jgi:5-methyltetrahydrofolate--homocysteine methyltransferase
MDNESEARMALDALKGAILKYDVDATKKAAQVIVDKGIDPLLANEEALLGSAGILHERFRSGECLFPHLVMAGDAITAAREILGSAVPGGSIPAQGIVVIGVVEADYHSIGKDIVATVFRTGGFEVHDLGVDVKSSTFISWAQQTKADIIAVSCLLTTTHPFQREVIEDLKAMGLRDKYKVMVGGGTISPEWAEEIGANGYGSDAMEGLEVARRLMGIEM